MKRSVDGQQEEARKAGKDEPARPACFDHDVQTRAAKELEEDGFCVIDLFSAREIGEIQQGLMNEVDQENPVNCRPLDDVVLSSETQASELFNKVVDVSFCRLAPLFDKRMMKRRLEKEAESKELEDILFESVYNGLFHLRTEPVPANLPLECTTPKKTWDSSGRWIKEGVYLFFVVPLWGKESRTFLKGSHRFENADKKMTPAIFQQMGGREKMINVSVEPGQGLVYSMNVFHRLAEKSKDEPACAFFSSCFKIRLSSDRKPPFGTFLTKQHNTATSDWNAIFCPKELKWIEDWLRKKSNKLEAEGKPDNHFGRTRNNMYQIIRSPSDYLYQIIGSVAHGLPEIISDGVDLGRPEITERAATTKFV